MAKINKRFYLKIINLSYLIMQIFINIYINIIMKILFYKSWLINLYIK